MKKNWKKISDDKVVTIWESTCNCPDAVQKIELHPCNFIAVGIPICSECGEELVYIETRIKVLRYDYE